MVKIVVLKYYDSPFHATESPEEASKSALKADIVIMIREIIECEGWTQKEAAENLKLKESEIVELLSGVLENFTLDQLFSILYKLGFGAEVTFGNLEEANIKIKKLTNAA